MLKSDFTFSVFAKPQNKWMRPARGRNPFYFFAFKDQYMKKFDKIDKKMYDEITARCERKGGDFE